MSDTLTNYKDNMSKCLPSMDTVMSVLKKLLILLFYLVIGYLLYHHIAGKDYSKIVNCTECLHTFISQSISNKQMISSKKFTSPVNGYCLSFVIFISDFYSTSGSWRHLMHKGSTITTGSDNNYNSFNSQGTNRQSPGLWLQPNNNNIRVVLSVRYSQKNETFDIDNINIGKWFTFSINIINETCEIYINGLLVRTYESQSYIEYELGDCYFLYNDNSSWVKIKNFRYIPNYLDAKVFAYIHQQDNLSSKSK